MTAPAAIGTFYAIAPGPGGDRPEYTFEHSLRALTAVLGRAAHLSAGYGPQEVTLTAGRDTKLIARYENGKSVFRAGAEIVPVAPPEVPAPQPADFGAYRQRRAARPEPAPRVEAWELGHRPAPDNHPLNRRASWT